MHRLFGTTNVHLIYHATQRNQVRTEVYASRHCLDREVLHHPDCATELEHRNLIVNTAGLPIVNEWRRQEFCCKQAQ